MNIIKRNGSENVFDKQKIVNAITKANKEVNEKDKLTEEQILSIACDIEDKASKCNYALNVEDIQDMVENAIVNYDKYQLAKTYILYRYERALSRNETTLEKKILSIIDFENEEVKQENSNKDPSIISVQRDYMAGEISREISKKYIFSKEVNEAHEAGIIHNHDTDYKSCHETNCCLVNLDDMLQNGTVISGTYIDKPHSFSTACNIATQIIAQVASSQYGGQTINLLDLAKFIDVSRQAIINSICDEYGDMPESVIKSILNKRLKKEIEKGVQILQYQIITLMTTNGLVKRLAVVKAS